MLSHNLNELSMNKRDSDGSFSRRLVSRFSDRYYNLITEHSKLSGSLARILDYFMCKSSDLAYTWSVAIT